MQYITSEMNVTVDVELKNLMPTQTANEIELLKASIQDEGIRDPVTIWEETGIIVDGMTRYRIGTELGIQIPFKYKSFDDILLVKKWMYENQAGRRNLTDRQRTILASEYRVIIKEITIENENAGIKVENKIGDSAKVAAEKFCVSNKSVTSYDAIIRDGIHEVQNLVRDDTVPLSTVAHLVKLDAPVQEDIVKRIQTSDGIDVAKLKAEVDAHRLKTVKDADIAKVQEKMTSPEVALDNAFRSWYENHINTLTTGSDQEKIKTQKVERKARFDALPADIKMLLIEGMPYYDVETLMVHDVEVTSGMTRDEIHHKADTLRITLRDEEFEKKQATAQKRKDTEARKAEEELITMEKEDLRRAIYSALSTLHKNMAAGTMICPVHGPNCKLHFDCGLSIDKAVEIAMDNISALRPEMVEIEGKENGEVRLADGTTTQVNKYKTYLERKEGDFGKIYKEE
jgi:hypothetical protein